MDQDSPPESIRILVRSHQQGEEGKTEGPPPQILKRPPVVKESPRVAELSTLKTLEEREEDYAKARERIFNSNLPAPQPTSQPCARFSRRGQLAPEEVHEYTRNPVRPVRQNFPVQPTFYPPTPFYFQPDVMTPLDPRLLPAPTVGGAQVPKPLVPQVPQRNFGPTWM
eukprot:NODE_5543_length_666_cov_48.034036_g5166_i0.p1 GENE.NODE_5543_length_666_cov_48.034036_g5166_i0~~NODE_5543_length_666_cov_48.034036_g5166_i0.p1  ORF type:complete len:168 (-),score=25.84 NODE_5543_length_666_cov_48.034036_g5166_i0:99-602(-)